jgi:hypothetical protein
MPAIWSTRPRRGTTLCGPSSVPGLMTALAPIRVRGDVTGSAERIRQTMPHRPDKRLELPDDLPRAQGTYVA